MKSALKRVRTRAQVINGFKEGDDGKIGDAGLFTEELDFEQVADCTGHANDVASDGLLTEFFARLANCIKGREHVLRFFAHVEFIAGKDARIAEEIRQEAHAL